MQTEQVNNNFYFYTNARSIRRSIMWMWKRIRLLYIRGHFIQFRSSRFPFFVCCVLLWAAVVIFEWCIKNFLCADNNYFDLVFTTSVDDDCKNYLHRKCGREKTTTNKWNSKLQQLKSRRAASECIQCMPMHVKSRVASKHNDIVISVWNNEISKWNEEKKCTHNRPIGLYASMSYVVRVVCGVWSCDGLYYFCSPTIYAQRVSAFDNLLRSVSLVTISDQMHYLELAKKQHNSMHRFSFQIHRESETEP